MEYKLQSFHPVMTPTRWQRIKEVFDSALEVSVGGRSSFLNDVCPDDPVLRREVERLLEEHASAGDFLQEPVVRPASLTTGEVVTRRYRIGKLLGRGGMGEVYEAFDQFLNETVALKTLRADLTRNENVVRRFQREIQLARKVTHPNVCRVFEVGMHEPVFGHAVRFFTMELLNGETLAARLRRKGKFTHAEAFPIAAQMAEGLQAAHTAGIVHTDFKSGNVILVAGPQSEKAVITDFGLARPAPNMTPGGETATMSVFGQVVGTVAYMSPEQLSGGTMTPASDIYSFGIVLFEMATGKLPFDDRHLIQSAMQRASGPVDVRSLAPDIDQRWESAIIRCLQKDPKKRFVSAEELAAWFDERGGWPASFKYWTRREWIRGGVAAGAALGVGGGAWYELTRPYQPAPAAMEWYQKGQAALHSMTYEAARKLLEQAVAADPKFALAHASLARAYDELDYSEQAKESLLRAMTVAQETRLSGADQTRLRALQALVSRDYDRAVPLFAQLESVAPAAERSAAAIETGWLAEKRDDSAGAAAAYQRALKLDTSYAAGKLRLGFILGRRGGKDDLAAALGAFEDAEKLYGASSDYEGITETLLQRANLLNRRSRAGEAMPVIEHALQVARTVGNRYQEIRLLLLQGVAVRNRGETRRAAEIAQQAIDQAAAEGMNNLATSGLLDMGNANLARGDFSTAEQIYRRALDLAKRGRIRRSEARAQAALGSLSEQAERPEEAKAYIDAALPFYRQAGFRREFVQASLVLGGVHEVLGEYEEGTRVIKEALDASTVLQDNSLTALGRERLADCLYGLGNFPACLEQYEAAGRLLKPGVEAGYVSVQRADLYWQLGRAEDARRSWDDLERALTASPDSSFGFSLRGSQAQFEYSLGRFNPCRSRIAEARRANPSAAAQDLQLLEALIAIRQGQAEAGKAVSTVLQAFNTKRMLGRAAAALLSQAEAELAANFPVRAQASAEEARLFFEPRKIWESLWRAHAILSRAASESALGRAHLNSARAALDELRKQWPAQDAESYLKRPDIQRLAQSL